MRELLVINFIVEKVMFPEAHMGPWSGAALRFRILHPNTS